MKNLKDFDEINNIQELVDRKDWEGIEDSFRRLCAKIAGEEFVVLVDDINFSSYKNVLEAKLFEAVQVAKENSTKAIYYSYDQNDYWKGSLLFCKNYVQKENVKKPGDDDWASEWDEELELPAFEEAYEVYKKSKGFFSKKYVGVTLYIASKIMKDLNQVAENLKVTNLSICMHFMIIRDGRAIFDDLIRLIEE